jgi:hypothetical protein
VIDEKGVPKPTRAVLCHLSKGTQAKTRTAQSTPRFRNFQLIPGGMVKRSVCCKSQVDMKEESSQAPSLEELTETITELTAYRERLYDDVVGLGKKLRLSQKKIDATIKEHPELTRIDAILTQLKLQRDTQESQA